MPARAARRPKRRRPGFQGVLDGLATEDGCLDVCLHNMGQFHVQTLKVRRKLVTSSCRLCARQY